MGGLFLLSPSCLTTLALRIKTKHSGPSISRRNWQIRSMRAVVQRVASANVEVEGKIISEIGPGLLVLVGVHESDLQSDADYICRKVLNMRLFTNDKTGKAWDQNVMQKKTMEFYWVYFKTGFLSLPPK
ncbi:hypothetical protein MKX03_032014 [Papaver bracteatum]|nr:hypothetical protein MKX03_032014 [Papaver bracteatum]